MVMIFVKMVMVSYSSVTHGFYLFIYLFIYFLILRSGGGSAQTYEECWNLSIFSRLGPFLQCFGQVKEWLKLELYEIIGMSHVVACLMLCILRRPERVVKELGVSGVSCRGKFKTWVSLNFANIVNFLSLFLCLIKRVF